MGVKCVNMSFLKSLLLSWEKNQGCSYCCTHSKLLCEKKAVNFVSNTLLLHRFGLSIGPLKIF